MRGPLSIAFKDIPHSDSLEAAIRRRVEKLDQYFHSIMGCRVTVESPHQRHHQGNLYKFRIVLNVPGTVITVGEGAKPEIGSHADPYVALRDAFDALERRLKSHAGKRRGRARAQNSIELASGSLHGRVARIVREGDDEADYGFIRTPDGREIYFHRHSVIDNAFDRLQPGDEVRFAEEMGEEGAQASTVHLVGIEGHHVAEFTKVRKGA